jgi:hypothetical protein
MIVALLLPVGQALAADASTEKEITVNFVPMHFIIDDVEYAPPADQPGFFYITDGGQTHTYVPLRFVANTLYKSVSWDGNAKKVTIAEPDPTIEADLAKQLVENSVIEAVDKSKLQAMKVVVSQTDITYEVNGVTVQPNVETPGFIYKSRVYVPLRFMYNSLGYDNDHIKFDSSTYTITAVSTEDQLAYKGILKSYASELETISAQVTGDITYLGTLNISKLVSGTATNEEKAAILEEGESILTAGKTRLDEKLGLLKDELVKANHPTHVVDHYVAYYDAKEQDARKLADKYLKPTTE